MKRTFLLAAALSIALPPVITSAATVQSNLAITVTSPPNQGGGGGDSGDSLLPADRDASANWQMAGLQSIGGISAVDATRTTSCGTLKPMGGGRDDSSQINTAIGNCPAGDVLNLAAGTFTIAEGNYILLNKGITLRGAPPVNGQLQTILHRPTSGQCPPPAGYGATMDCYSGGTSPTTIILISPVARYVGLGNLNGCALMSDIAAGSTTATVSSSCASLFSPGQFVVLDELSGYQDMPDPENPCCSIWAAPDYRVAYHIHTPSVSGDDGTDVMSDYTLHTDRVTNEIKQIKSVSGNTITFDDPATISYRVSHTAELWVYQNPWLQKAGLEDVVTEYGDDGDIQMQYCAYCWLHQVEARYGIGPTVQMNTTFRAQIEQSYIHDAAWPSPGGAGYLIDMRFDSAESLIENSISIRGNKVMTARGSGAGSVIAYNYVDDAYDLGSDGWQEIGLNASHLVGPHHVLFEGNWTFNMDSDATHGGSIYMTYFRNWSTAIRSTFTGLDGYVQNDSANDCGATAWSGSPLRATGPQAYSYWFSFVGNVLGTPGCTTAANNFPLNNYFGGPYNSDGIFLLGWFNAGNGQNDPTVATIYPATPQGVNGTNSSCMTSGTNCATILDGNYDYVRNQIVWATNDTAHTLPSSFYLGSEPSFFTAGASCTYTWPWVNPTGSTLVYTNSCGGSGLPAKARYDAGTPFSQP
ncbi:MAG TPA: hypothetical protein VJ770_12980 [Stellaceae bacterium]|nr:hypothetical protein [Stellaceae bacterium]